MRYVLTKATAGRTPEIHLSEAQYLKIKHARRALTHGISIEEKYDLLLSNYSDFEIELLRIASDMMINRDDGLSYSHFFQITTHMNRRLVNLLTAARIYLEHLDRHISGCLESPAETDCDIEGIQAQEYSASFEYRFMEALRNSVQHYGFPVHSTMLNMAVDKYDGGKGHLYSLEIFALKEKLQENKKFKKGVLKETPSEVDLKLTTRKYVESVSRIHGAAREMTSSSLAAHRKVIEACISNYASRHKGSNAGLCAFKLSDENGELEEIGLNLDWDDIRITMVKKNRILVKLSDRFVTNRLYTKT